MRKLDYSNLMHRNNDVPRNLSVRNSFYMRKGNGRTGMYNETGFGDVSVFTVAPSVCRRSESVCNS